jgi:hypothetical protein
MIVESLGSEDFRRVDSTSKMMENQGGIGIAWQSGNQGRVPLFGSIEEQDRKARWLHRLVWLLPPSVVEAAGVR